MHLWKKQQVAVVQLFVSSCAIHNIAMYDLVSSKKNVT